MEKIKNLKYSAFAMLLILCTVHLPRAQSIDARLLADTTEMLIGDQIRLSLSVTHSPEISPQWPALDSIPGFEILSFTRVDSTVSQDDRITRSQQFTLTSFDSGSYRIPPLDIYYTLSGDTSRKATFTNALALEVKTVAVDTASEIKPIKDIRGAPIAFSDFLPYILLAIAIALVSWFIIRRIRNRPVKQPQVQKPAAPPVPAHEIAMRKLALLEEKRLWQKDFIKEYYSELTDVFREYLENRFLIMAMESTTGEIVQNMRQVHTFTQRQIQQVETLLTTADLAKFAKAKPEAGENLEAMEIIRHFVKDTAVASATPPANAQETQPVTDHQP
ncbi:MAG: BatD family protein [Bacteroidia bacterium]